MQDALIGIRISVIRFLTAFFLSHGVFLRDGKIHGLNFSSRTSVHHSYDSSMRSGVKRLDSDLLQRPYWPHLPLGIGLASLPKHPTAHRERSHRDNHSQLRHRQRGSQ